MKKLLMFWKPFFKQKKGTSLLFILLVLAGTVLCATCQVKVDSSLANFVLPGEEANIAVTQETTTISHNGSAVDFGLSALTRDFTITNGGGQDLSIYSVFIVQSGSEFSIDTSNLSDTLIAEGTTTFSVTYNPAGSSRITASITVVSNDPDQEQFVVNIVGGGTTLDLSFAQDTGYRLSGYGYDFGYNASSSNATLSFTNNESFDLVLAGSTTSGAFSTAAPSSTELAAGGTTGITVTYAPVTDASSKADMTITDTYGRTYTLKLQGSNLEPPDYSTLGPDLALWLNTEDIRVSHTAVSGPNTYVSTWPDSSGRSEDLDADASTSPTDRRPLYIENGLNSHPILRFDGSDDYMFVNPGTDKFIYYNDDETTVFIVFTQGTTNNRYLMSGPYTAPNYSAWPRCYLDYSGGGRFRVYGYNDWYTSDPADPGAWTTGTSYLWTLEKDLAAADMLKVWINLTELGESSNNVVYDTGGNKYRNQHLDKLIIGATYNYTTLFQGDLAEIIIYTRKLTVQETGWVNDYINDKYTLW